MRKLNRMGASLMGIVTLLAKRRSRLLEIQALFGVFSKWPWMTLFPPFKGWDVGCGYCALEQDSIKAHRCDRSVEFGHEGFCGVHEKPTAGKETP